MKKILSPLFAVFVFVLASCGGSSSYTDPVAYNDAIVNEQILVYNKLDSLETILNADIIDEENINGAFEDAITTVTKSIQNVEKMSFKGDENFKNSTIALFTEIKNLFENDYKELYELYKKPIEDWEDADYDLMYDIWDGINESIMNKEDAFLDAQNDFAEAHDITLF